MGKGARGVLIGTGEKAEGTRWRRGVGGGGTRKPRRGVYTCRREPRTQNALRAAATAAAAESTPKCISGRRYCGSYIHPKMRCRLLLSLFFSFRSQNYLTCHDMSDDDDIINAI